MADWRDDGGWREKWTKKSVVVDGGTSAVGVFGLGPKRLASGRRAVGDTRRRATWKGKNSFEIKDDDVPLQTRVRLRTGFGLRPYSKRLVFSV